MVFVDYAILVFYLAGLFGIAAWLARRAAQGSDHYFLGGRRLPWWALGSSGMSSNLDAAGTMTILTLIYLYGLHGFFIEMRGGVVLPIAVFLAFMGKWHQRSGVVTTAEWMRLRFGPGAQGTAARVTAAFTYLVITVAMVVFFLAAAGTFLAVFLPWDPVTCAVAMALIGLTYTLVSGLYGVVWTDVFQSFLIAAAAAYVAVTASGLVSPELVAAWPGAAFNDPLPRLADGGLAPYELFWVFLVFWVGKGVLEGLGGSGGSAYMAQRFYAAPSAAATRKVAMLWCVLFAFRWPMVLGFAVIAIHLGVGREDPEQILPLVLQSEFFPAGVRGLIVAAIFAASMSTFDSTINAGASYVVKDIFQPLRPRASERTLVVAGYVASVLIVALGLFLALTFADSVLGVWTTIVIQLFPAFLVPFALRWFWARFNGAGFTAGIVAGFAASTAVSFGWGGLDFNEAQTLVFVGFVSLAGSLAGTFAAMPPDRATLEEFYKRVRPFGLWPADWKAPHRRELRADLLRLPVALAWQVSTFMLPMLAVLRMWGACAAVAALFAATGAYLLLELRRGDGNAESSASG